MSDSRNETKPFTALHNWLITLAIILISIFGVILSLICIYALPDQSVRPDIGAIFFIVSAILIAALLFLRWNKEKALENKTISTNTNETDTIIIKETISDKILKWIVTIYSLFFAFDGIAITLICIYALPDKTVQPKVGIIYFFSGTIILASFLFVVWKNYISGKKP